MLAGQIEVENGRLRLAEAHFLATLTREPANAHAHRELVYIDNVQHRLSAMDAHMDALSELNALGFEHLLHWSKVRNVVWDPSHNCQSLAKYLAADPDDRYTRLALVDGLQNLGRLDEAASVLAFLPDSDDEARVRTAPSWPWLAATPHGPTACSQPGRSTIASLGESTRSDRPGPARSGRRSCVNCADCPRGHPDDFGVLSALATRCGSWATRSDAKTYIEAQARTHRRYAVDRTGSDPAGASDTALPAAGCRM